jgi:fibronectin-binding autotransporter adhesin
VTTFTAGTVSVATIGNGGVAGNLGQAASTANRLVFSGGTLQYTGATASTNRSFTLTGGSSGTIDVTGAGTNLTISGASTNTTGSLTKIGDGTLTLSGANLHTGATNVGTAGGFSGGTLAYGGSDILSTGTVNVYGGTLDLNSRKDTIGALNLGGGGAGTTASVTGTTGTLTLGGNLTYNATNNPNGAVVSADLNLGSANRTFTVNDSSAAATDLTISGKVSAASRNLIITGAGDSAISGNIATGAGSLTKQGTGTLTISGTAANTFTGNLAINEGTVNLNKTDGINAASSGTVIVGDGVGTAGSANLVYQAGNQLADAADLTLNADGHLALGTFSDSVSTLNGTGLLDLGTTGELILGADGGASLFSGSITGSGNLEVSALGNLTLGSDISYTGSLTLAGGTLVLNDSDLTVTDLVITGNSIIDFAGVSSNLFATNLIFANTSVTLMILNWELATDYFLASTWDGAVRGIDAQGAIPMNQITFDGWTNNETGWEEYTDRIRPNVPEPSTYGLILTGAGLALFGYRRWRAARRPSNS